ncbi:hypothetical protein PBI_TEAMOCIL_96 [Microbacterium phage Teamocil]|uniref:Uncharacterized protein n=1 Tax=Microbacterium phage Teamocil TaxID=2656554 RepID=A0A649VXV5_9CAUD|nr:hypothetical protein QDA12_gp96 [Microbacterium phage Teamocil]QGJ88947.1 hypothetical protein PBI_GINA_96 [Microbacterium phage Gina]QGJ97044.1 hypothetical protein PBI_TEAMOCIL_96 [Microbacterium phage Teamocil]
MSDQPKIAVTIITQRRSLDVREGYLRGSGSFVDVDVCVACGSIVFDPVVHDQWHTSALSPLLALIAEHQRREEHNETVPLNRISDIQPEPSSADYRRALGLEH